MNAVTTMVQAKSFFSSKTVRLNALFLIVSVFGLLNEIQAVALAFEDIIVIPPEVTRWLLFINTIANLILRRVSDQPVRFREENRVVEVPAAIPPALGGLAARRP